MNTTEPPRKRWHRWGRPRRATIRLPLEENVRDEMLMSILTDLNGSSLDVEASALISADGLMMASLLPPGLEDDRIGAMSAAILALGARTSSELDRGELEQILIKGDKGYVLLTQAGSEAVLAVMTKASARLGLTFLDVRRAAEKVAKIV